MIGINVLVNIFTQIILNKMWKYRIFFILVVILFLPGSKVFAQTLDPISLHFEKDYQVRNFYNSSVILSNLDLSTDIFDESEYPKNHLTSPGCDFEQKDQSLHISNKYGSEQQSFIT